MLLVKTYLAASDIHGVGLFALEFVPAGTKVAIFDPDYDLAYRKEELERMPSLLREYIEVYGFGDPQHPGAYLCSIDNARFMNHSDTPNLVEADDGAYAVRDIRAGEEITTDYRQLEADFDAGELGGTPTHQ